MNQDGQMQAMKLHILVSLARSEQAIAKLMESALNDTTLLPQDFNRLYELLSSHYHVLLRKIDLLMDASLKLKVVVSKPQKPWINLPRRRK